ncbi:hypothetical protein G9444_0871 [Rhodococcus erythropolis]|uniref:Alpha/beta hydrolase n=1 Tax=Rhodococcus erythropolis TaxID=1833 RepID=A0A6G9CM57_RHOER|nr:MULTISPECIES: hypothetical protein [Rhodococcus]MCJ0896690.1 alpha/beta hydrolase [Rhodococcus sp. ARC_M13]QIP38115.1 hypothetical protein G9444_0871 [Rhodococcus erythropolis]UKO87357.1 alpha/beta hydrolase [Rhodococcus erythropolis]
MAASRVIRVPLWTVSALLVSTATACSSEQVGPISVEWLADPTPGVRTAVYQEHPTAITLAGGAEGRDTEELRAVVYFSKEAAGNEHLIFLQHGGRQPCSDPGDSWPCRSENERTPSFLGFGYLGAALAAQGNVVVSISANSTVASADTDHSGAVFNRHTELWRDWNREDSGPFGEVFTDQLDLASIGLIGHSRGGDAVARYASGDAGSPPLLPISAMLLLAPVLPIKGQLPALPDIPTVITEGTCDGDVARDPSGYVEGRRPAPQGNTVLITIAGANHNFFNTEWSPSNGRADSIDDADPSKNPHSPCTATTPRLDENDQRTLAIDIATTTFRAVETNSRVATALTEDLSDRPDIRMAVFG